MADETEDKKTLCQFNGQLYYCAADTWDDQKECGYGLKSPHREQCTFYNCGYNGRCDEMQANKAARENN